MRHSSSATGFFASLTVLAILSGMRMLINEGLVVAQDEQGRRGNSMDFSGSEVRASSDAARKGKAQEKIEMRDLAVVPARRFHGLTITSERPRHRMIETWHPLGPVGIITAFEIGGAFGGEKATGSGRLSSPIASIAIHEAGQAQDLAGGHSAPGPAGPRTVSTRSSTAMTTSR